jgi:putative tryptophan/tyrosine transport system substrate-binding protein
VRRRNLLAGIAAAALAPRAALAEAPKVVGILAPAPLRPIGVFKKRLGELGWVEGRNVRFEDRWAEGDDGRYAALAADLAGLRIDAILTWSTAAVLAAKRATTTIPIVMAAIGDPVGVGAVTGLARPEGNVTGFSTQNFELEEKRFELLRELVPALRGMVMLGNAATNPYAQLAMTRVKDLATAAGVSFATINIDDIGGLENGLDHIRRSRAEGVLVMAAPALFPYRKTIAEFMAANRIPAVYPFREFAEAGGLLVYATNFDDLFRQAAEYVDKVLRGTPPGELPVQQAATFELVLNMRAAKAIGLTIPPVLLARADEVIE